MKRAAAKVAREIADHLDGWRKSPYVREAGYPDKGILVPVTELQSWLLLLAPPQKRRAPTHSQVDREAHRASVKELDDLYRALIRKRDGMRCRRCKKESHLQVAHIFSRRFHKLRWTPTNALLLCGGCHMWGHHNPIGAGKFFEEAIGTREYIRLSGLKNSYGKAPDHRLVKLHLEKELG